MSGIALPSRTSLEVTVGSSLLADAVADVLVVGAFAGDGAGEDRRVELAADAASLASATSLDLVGELQAMAFEATVGATAVIPTRGAADAAVIVVVGLGQRALATPVQLRRACATLVSVVVRHRRLATGLHTTLPDCSIADATRAVVEGVVLGTYRYQHFHTKPKPMHVGSLALLAASDVAPVETVEAVVPAALAAADAACLVRDLVNTPPQAKRPPQFAQFAEQAVADLPIDVRVFDEQALDQGGYGGLLGVGQGSSAPPRLVELRYRPSGATKHVALIGKGITFDSGGLSLKPSASMETMKCDMAGAATMLAVMRAAARLQLPVELTCLLALAENMPSGSATRVSDVLTMYGGTTVEVLNTDAEGRLVLADAIAHAGELGPDVIVDAATLTGAAVVALGDRYSVVIANDATLAKEFIDAGARAGEPMWELPLAKDEYGDRVSGTFADLRNVGNRAAGTIFAALFLERFVAEGVQWAHLDIAGPAYTEEPYGEYSKGGTGVPARTLLTWLTDLASQGR